MISPEALEKARSLVANYGSDPDGLLVGAIAAALQAERDAAASKLAALDALLNKDHPLFVQQGEIIGERNDKNR